MKAIHVWVSGQAQGVFFRASGAQQAIHHSLNGWVRNCRNGNVECIVQGEVEQLKLFGDWLNIGPSSAMVAAVQIENITPDPDLKKFSIRQTQ